jgi:hypothetical protein
MTTPEKKALRIAAATLKSARLTAKASKARLRALKSEVKIQKQHHKWARKQVRVAKEALAQWQATAEAAPEPPQATPPAEGEIEPPVHADSGKTGHKKKALKRKKAALALERITLIPVAPKAGAVAVRSAANPPAANPNEPPPVATPDAPLAMDEVAGASGTETAH